MKKIAALAGLFLVGSAAAFSQEARQADRAKPAVQAVAADPAELAASAEMSARAVDAIPLFRTSGGVRILPFIDPEGAPVEIEKPLLAFQILPFPDERGRLIPILRDGIHILPFVDESGEPIPIRRPRVREAEAR
ncbi:MAG: hypothetical protein ABI592_08495 [Acidobacteriota bacterium]